MLARRFGRFKHAKVCGAIFSIVVQKRYMDYHSFCSAESSEYTVGPIKDVYHHEFVDASSTDSLRMCGSNNVVSYDEKLMCDPISEIAVLAKHKYIHKGISEYALHPVTSEACRRVSELWSSMPNEHDSFWTHFFGLYPAVQKAFPSSETRVEFTKAMGELLRITHDEALCKASSRPVVMKLMTERYISMAYYMRIVESMIASTCALPGVTEYEKDAVTRVTERLFKIFFNLNKEQPWATESYTSVYEFPVSPTRYMADAGYW